MSTQSQMNRKAVAEFKNLENLLREQKLDNRRHTFVFYVEGEPAKTVITSQIDGITLKLKSVQRISTVHIQGTLLLGFVSASVASRSVCQELVISMERLKSVVDIEPVCIMGEDTFSVERLRMTLQVSNKNKHAKNNGNI